MAITETLKYFKHMSFGHSIIVKTDHKNLTHHLSNHASNRVLHQCLLLEEYGAELQYIKDQCNVMADALSRIPTEDIFVFEEAEDFPLNLQHLAKKQLTNDHLKQALQKAAPDYVELMRDGLKIYVCKHTDTIYIPASLRAAIIQWYHTSLQQATMKENFYWPSIDAAIDTAVMASKSHLRQWIGVH